MTNCEYIERPAFALFQDLLAAAAAELALVRDGYGALTEAALNGLRAAADAGMAPALPGLLALQEEDRLRQHLEQVETALHALAEALAAPPAEAVAALRLSLRERQTLETVRGRMLAALGDAEPHTPATTAPASGDVDLF